MFKIWAVFVLLILPATAYAGCVGAGIGDGCIGIPTPEHRYENHRDHVIVDHRHHHPVVIERHDEDEDDDE